MLVSAARFVDSFCKSMTPRLSVCLSTSKGTLYGRACASFAALWHLAQEDPAPSRRGGGAVVRGHGATGHGRPRGVVDRHRVSAAKDRRERDWGERRRAARVSTRKREGEGDIQRWGERLPAPDGSGRSRGSDRVAR